MPINAISILCNMLEGAEFSRKMKQCRVLKDTGAECEKHLIGQVASEQRLEGAEEVTCKSGYLGKIICSQREQ